jgi:hypothetical protein
MPLWNRVKQELDRAGKVAQDALDEGKVRLEAFRARQLADKAAQALGYALYRARAGGGELDADTYERLRQTLARHESEANRLETTLEQMAKSRRGPGSAIVPTSQPLSDAPPPPPTSDSTM